MEHDSPSPAPSTREQSRPVRSEHGHSVAAWNTVSLVILGVLIGGIGVWLASPVWFCIGVATVVGSWGVGAVLSVLGFGAVPSYSVESPADSPAEGPDRPRQ